MRPFTSSVPDESGYAQMDIHPPKNDIVLKVKVCYQVLLTAIEPDKLVVLWHNRREVSDPEASRWDWAAYRNGQRCPLLGLYLNW